MIKIPVSSKTPSAVWPRAGAPDYVFSVRSFGGQSLGVDLKEFDWRLEVDSRRGLVTVQSFRSDADLPGQPLGVFRQSLDDQQLGDFLKLVNEAKLETLHPAMTTHPGYTERLYVLTRPRHAPQQMTINNSDEQTNALIAPLRNRINSLLAASFGHPERAVKLGLARSGDGLEVSITNIGTEPVCLSDPSWLVASGPLHRAAVMITEFPAQKPGEAPPMLAWREIPLESMVPYPLKEPLVTLAAGAVWKSSVTGWKREAGKRYLAYFTWANYAGEPMVAKVYRIRGRADSPRLVLEP